MSYCQEHLMITTNDTIHKCLKHYCFIPLYVFVFIFRLNYTIIPNRLGGAIDYKYILKYFAL